MAAAGFAKGVLGGDKGKAAGPAAGPHPHSGQAPVSRVE
jgi:hypothetical protein